MHTKLLSPIYTPAETNQPTHGTRVSFGQNPGEGFKWGSILCQCEHKGPWAQKYLQFRSSGLFVWILSTKWLFLFYLKMFYWSLVDLQCSVSFRWTAKWITPTHISTPFFFFKIFFSRLGYYRALTRVPCATQQVLMSYLCYIYSVYMSTPISQPLLHSLSFGCTVSLMLRMGFLQLQWAGAILSLQSAGFSLWWLVLLPSTGSRH